MDACVPQREQERHQADGEEDGVHVTLAGCDERRRLAVEGRVDRLAANRRGETRERVGDDSEDGHLEAGDGSGVPAAAEEGLEPHGDEGEEEAGQAGRPESVRDADRGEPLDVQVDVREQSEEEHPQRTGPGPAPVTSPQQQVRGRYVEEERNPQEPGPVHRD